MKLKYVGFDPDYDEDFTHGNVYDARPSLWGEHYDVTDNHNELWLVKSSDECFQVVES